MSETRKANVPEATYFATLTVVGWIDVFTRSEYADEIVANLKYCQDKKSLEIFAYVIMSSHLHLLCRRREGLLSDLLRGFKSYTAKKLTKQIADNPFESRKDWLKLCFEYHARLQRQNAEVMFWQKTSHPIEMTTPEMFQQKMDYIHNNPITAGIVTDASYYHYSSANPMSPLKIDDY